MLSPAVVGELQTRGLTPAPKPFTQFNLDPQGAALECPWGMDGDYHSHAYYAWAQLLPGEKDRLLSQAAESDYATVNAPEGTYLVWEGEGPGAGSGILVTDGWVAFADTPENIWNIVWTT